jgi:hypothetical protein
MPLGKSNTATVVALSALAAGVLLTPSVLEAQEKRLTFGLPGV